MSITSIDHYTVDPVRVQIPDEGLGEFIVGFTEENKPFNWTNILWNLLPGAGQLFFVGHVLRHWWVKTHPDRILLYKNGFIKQTLDNKGRVKKELTFNFYELNGVLLGKTRQYQNIYGIRKYNATTVQLSVLDEHNVKEVILSGSYRNENEIEGNYNFIGYACLAINNAWIQFAIKKFNEEFSSKGYASFSTPNGEVLVGSDFIKANNIVVSSGFKYSFDNGYLYIYPNAAEGGHFKNNSKPVVINVAGMFNKEVFLLAIGQIHGIR